MSTGKRIGLIAGLAAVLLFGALQGGFAGGDAGAEFGSADSHRPATASIEGDGQAEAVLPSIEARPFQEETDSTLAGVDRQIRGLLLAPDGTPVPNACLALHRDPSHGEGLVLETPVLTTTRSDAEGRFRFDHALLRSQSYRLRIESDEHPILHARGFHPVRPQTLERTLTLKPGLVLSGRVRNASGQAIAGCRLFVDEIEVEGQPPRTRHERETSSSADGSFHFPALSQGAKLLRVEHPSYATTTLRVALRDPKQTRDVTLEAGEQIAGQVRDPRGRPVAGVRVLARIADHWRSAPPGDRPRHPLGSRPRIDPSLARPAPDGSFRMMPVWPRPLAERAHADVSALTDEQGRFVLRGLVRASFLLRVESQRHACFWEWEARSGDAGVELQVSALASFAGRVIDAESGAPIPAFLVAVAPHRQSGLIAQGLRRQRSDAEGRFGPLPAPAGRQAVHVWADGYLPATTELLPCNAGVVHENLLVKLIRGADLEGRVLDAEGRGIAGVRISLRHALPAQREGLALSYAMLRREGGDLRGHQTLSGKDGRYRLEAIPEGRFEILVEHPRFAADERPLVVSSGDGHLRVPDLVLSPAAGIRGRLLGATPNARIVLCSTRHDGTIRVLHTDAAGAFTVDGLPAGDYRIVSLEGARPNPERFLAALRHAPAFQLAAGRIADGIVLGKAPETPVSPK